jgi:hypothetical protein
MDKTLLVIVFCSLSLASSPQKGGSRLFLAGGTQPDEVEREYLNFIVKYGKSYVSRDEHINRFKVFKTNYLNMMVHNSKDSPFKLGINKFADLTDEEFSKIYLSSGI